MMSLQSEKFPISMMVKGLPNRYRTKSNMDGMDKLVQTLDMDFTGIQLFKSS